MSSLVIGGGGGIGAAVARRLSRDSDVVVTYLEEAARATALAAELNAMRLGSCSVVRCDATSEASLHSAFLIAEEFGPVSQSIFCAGGWTFPRLSELTEAAIRAELDRNLVSALVFLAESARHVADGGRVVLISSVAAEMAPVRQAPYAAAKAGLEAASRVAAKELAGRGITVNVVRPGATDTAALRSTTSDKAIQAMADANAMRRLGTPEDIAGAVEALLAPSSGWITGSVIEASGGLR